MAKRTEMATAPAVGSMASINPKHAKKPARLTLESNQRNFGLKEGLDARASKNVA